MADDIRQTIFIEASLTKIQSDLKTLEGNFAASFGNIKNFATSALGAFGVGLGVGSVVQFGRAIGDLADTLQNLHEQTGVSVELLSGAKSILEESGTSVEAFAKGIFNLQKSLGGIDKETDPAAQAIKRLGLNLDSLRNSSPDEAVRQITEALAKIENPTERARVSSTLLEKSARELGPALLALAGNFDKVKRSGLSAADVKAIDDVGDALTRLGNQALFLGSVGTANILRFFGAMRDASKVGADIDGLTKLLSRSSGIPSGRIEGMSSKELASLQPGPLADSGNFRFARDELIKLREEFDKLNQVNVVKPQAVFKGISDGAKKAKSDVKNFVDGFLNDLEKQLGQIESKKIELRFGADFALGAGLDKQFEDFKEKLREKGLPIPKGLEEFFRSLKDRILAGNEELKRMQFELARLDELGKAFDQDSQEWGRAIEDNAKAAAEALAKIEPAFRDLQKQMSIDILPADQQGAARANQEFEARIRVINEWRDAEIRAGRDVAAVNAEAAQATADAWVTTYDQIKEKSDETSEFIRTAFERGFGAVSDALEEFLNEGFTSFEDFGKKILRTINKLLADQITLGLKDLLLGEDFGKKGAGVGGVLGDLFGGLFGSSKKASRQLPGTTGEDTKDAQEGQILRDAAAADAQAAITAQVTTAEASIQAVSTAATAAIQTESVMGQTAIQTTGATAQAGIQALLSAALATLESATAGKKSSGSEGGMDLGPLFSMFQIGDGSAGDAGAYSEGGGLVGGMGYHRGGLVTPGGEASSFRRRLPRYHVGGEVNAVLRSGEYVVNDWASSMIGKPALDYANATGRLPGANHGSDRGGRAINIVQNIQTTDAASFMRSKREIKTQVRAMFRTLDRL